MFSVIIPVFNESGNIDKLLNEIHNHLKKFEYEIIIVDDCSNDDTIKEIKNFKKKNINLLVNKINMGQSFSLNKGILSSRFNIIVTLDGDGQNNPNDIIKLLNIYNSEEDISLVGGLRMDRKDSFVKIFSSQIANYIRSKILKDNCKDTGCALKVFDKNVYLEFSFFNGIHRFLPALFNGYGYKTTYVNVDHRKRINGYSKYGINNRLFRGIRDMIKVNKMIKTHKLK